MNAILFSAYALVNVSQQTTMFSHLHFPGVGHLYYDSSQYTICGDAQITAVLRKDFQRPGRKEEHCPEDRPPQLIFRKEAGVVILSAALRQWCFGAAEGGGMFVAGLGPDGDLIGAAAGAHCIPLGGGRSHLELDIDVLKGVGDTEMPPPSPAIRCAALLDVLHTSAQEGPLFSVFTGMGARRREIEYWLDFCAVDLPTLHLWEYSDYYKEDLDESYVSYTSRCTVRKVTSFHIAHRSSDGEKAGAMHCIEDFIYQIWVTEQRPNSITFLSPGVGPPRHDQSPQRKEHQREYINEILAATSAFVDSSFGRFNIRSMWKHRNLLQDNTQATSFRNMLQALIQSSSADEWDAGVDSLWDELSGCSLLESDDLWSVSQCWGRLSTLLAYEFSAVRSSLSFLGNGDNRSDRFLQLAQFFRRVAMTTAQSPLPYLRRYDDAVTIRSECGDFFSSVASYGDLNIPSMTAAAAQLLVASRALEARFEPANVDARGQRRGYCKVSNSHSVENNDEPEIIFLGFNGYSPNGPPRSGHPSIYDLPVSFTDSHFSAEHHSWKTEIVNVKNSEGKVYVLCFVRAGEDLSLGREIVQKWREGCHGCRFHAVFTLYELPSCGDFSGDLHEMACTLRYLFVQSIAWHVYC